MTVVELIDAHDGFRLLTDRITTTSARTLLWLVSLIAFFLSAVLDNLTTSIVMMSLLRKLIRDDEQRRFYAGIVIIAANAGGAWSPLGDVTTTMLWIGGQITAANITKELFLPSLVSLLVPLLFLTFKLRGSLEKPPRPAPDENTVPVSAFESNLMLGLGVLVLLFVPVFKTLTHLPPYMGMLLALGIMWVASEILHSGKDDEDKEPLTAAYALTRIDTPSILFFLGILVAIGALEATGLLRTLATTLDQRIGDQDLIVVLIGVASAIIDNVPLVAATMGMYPLDQFPTDHKLWEFLAYCAGTGGSLLVIGSAAGVAVMGMERLDFLWYLRRISLLALLGYLAGVLAYLGLFALLKA
jgi:Na+/H+ antiporter NhaD/arsenite permease-like protein